MRITGGRLKGRTLKVPKSDLIRPTTDRVRESLFNYLNNIFEFETAKVCDIYAGSGSLGFECLSRGASSIDFVEKNYVIYKNLVNNIDAMGEKENCKIYKMPALKFSSMKDHAQYDFIIADPPFFKYDIHSVVKNLLENKFIHSNGLIVVERSIQTEEKDVDAFGKSPDKRIGDSLIYLFD
ncbi:MAG: 16S rRNA (guanine(966)-N(2))-methyltransferase RsmD [Ignavibacteria bacterium]|nr:MAG: 16S rRNA (guanine(966)-N(2))-methyltransferase RsmD [Ignavibacteria bacterium]